MTLVSFVAGHTPVVRRRWLNGSHQARVARRHHFHWTRHATDVSNMDNDYAALEFRHRPAARRDGGWQRPC